MPAGRDPLEEARINKDYRCGEVLLILLLALVFGLGADSWRERRVGLGGIGIIKIRPEGSTTWLYTNTEAVNRRR